MPPVVRPFLPASSKPVPVDERTLARSSAWLSLFLLIACVDRAQAQGVPSPDASLRSVLQVHTLDSAQARRGLPFHLRGVVTTLSPWPNAFFLQDATGGISIQSDVPTGVHPQDEIQIDGVTAPGLFAPIARATQVRVLHPGKMPPARLFSYPELTGGGQDGNWITLQGIVRSVKMAESFGTPIMTLTLEVDGTLVGIETVSIDLQQARELVDSVVRVRGVCTTTFNDKRQFTGIGLLFPSLTFVQVKERPPGDPFAEPAVAVRNLLQFKPGMRYGHRVRLQGVVTYQDIGHSLFIQQGQDGVLVESDQIDKLPLGTRVDAVGFPAAGTYSPILREATYRILQEGVSVTPLPLAAKDFLHQGRFITAPNDAQLVTIKGQLIETTNRLTDDGWLLRDGKTHFMAILKHVPGAPPPLEIADGSTVSVTGVFAVQVDDNKEPTSFRVLLRTSNDLVVLKQASWWTPTHAVDVLAAVLLLTLAISLWGTLLRRTVRRQTRMLRESEERFRHLAQNDTLTGLASRSFLHEQLDEAVGKARGGGQRFALLMVDLDHFKQVNDTLGHHAGDELLCLVAGRIRHSVRKDDLVARMGGDEFVVLLAGIDADEAGRIGAQVVANVSAPAEVAGQAMPISASVGVCGFPEGGTSAESLLQNVDAAMYQAKAAGRNSFSVYGHRAKEEKPAPQLTGARA